MSQHHATFTWGVGPQTVFVAGGFNNWSGDATPLHKQPDGSFSAEVPMPWGEKQAFKYVVDGEWKVREDEAKEWDAAGNMNNVYTAPPAPVEPAHAPAPVAAATTTTTSTSEPTAVPSTETPDAPAPAPATKKTEPETLLASSAPAPASNGDHYVLGAVSGNATAAAPVVPAPAAEPTPQVIEKTAATAPIGEATPAATSTDETAQSITAQAAAYGAAALGALGAVAGTAAVAVEKATGIDLTHSQPLSVEEAKAQGIDVASLPKVDAATDATSPAGTAPPASAVDALEEKTKALKLDAPAAQAAVPLPNGSAPKTSTDPALLDKVEQAAQTTSTGATAHDIPAQVDTTANHTHVPMPVITNLGEKDVSKDRSLDAIENRDEVATKPIDNDPAVSAKEAKDAAEAKTAIPVAAAEVPAAPSTPASAPVVPAKEVSPVAPVVPSPATTTASPAAPATPAKTTPAATATTPASIASTPASTPVKSAHTKEGTAGSDVRKRKSSFFAKIKERFNSPKDKAK